MKKVIYSEYVKKQKDEPYRGQHGGPGKPYWELEEKGEAIFHQFGVAFEELENGVGNFSTAIIELEDKTIKNIPVENIKFI